MIPLANGVAILETGAAPLHAALGTAVVIIIPRYFNENKKPSAPSTFRSL
jgi:hypothetical protein